MCFGGGGAAPAVPAMPAPPQAAVAPVPAGVRSGVANQVQQQGLSSNSTLLTGGLGAPISASQLGSKTLLGA